MPAKGDVSDWLNQGRNKEELWQHATNTPIWQKPAAGVPPEAVQPAQEPAEPEPPPFVPFPTDALPAVVADYVHQGVAALGCDESYIAPPLLAVLLEQQPRGLLMARDELSGWVNSFDAYKSCRGADVVHWLSMHRAGNVIWDRKTGRHVIDVPRAAVSITGGIQFRPGSNSCPSVEPPPRTVL